MNIDAVMDEVGKMLDEIPGLAVLPFAATSVGPLLPGALISIPPNGEYDLTYGQGLDRVRMEVVVLVSRGSDLAARKALTPFISGSGEQSIRAKLGTRGTKWSTCDEVKVLGFNALRVTMTDGKYLGAMFPLDVYGIGGA